MQSNPYPLPIGNLFTADSIYRMPLFQRKYVWTEKKNLEEFKSDISKLIDVYTSDENSKVFLGAVILQEHRGTQSTADSKEFTVIDGQQRMTTIYLTILALCKFAKEKGFDDEAESLKDRYLLSAGVSTKNYPKIIPTNFDTEQFKNILNDIDFLGAKLPSVRGDNSGRLKSAYKFIKEKVVEELILLWAEEYSWTEKESFDHFRDLFSNRMVLADITLNSYEHDPFEVFNRLNVSGTRLEKMDLIRNEVFKPYGGRPDEADSFFDSTWEPFQKKLEGIFPNDTRENIEKNTQNFFHPYALTFDPKIRQTTIVHDLISQWNTHFSSDRNFDPKRAVQSMSDFVEYYRIILTGEAPDWITSKSLKSAIIDLVSMKIYTATYSFIMANLHALHNNKLDASSVEKNFRIVESFIVRRTFANEEEGTGIHAIFKSLWVKSKGAPKEVRKNIISRTKSFPNDAQFSDGIMNTDLYGKKIEKYCLLKYEEYLNDKEFETFPNQIIESTDHILPQSWKGSRQGGTVWANIAEKEKFSQLVGTWGNLLPMSKKLNINKSNNTNHEIYQLIKDESKFSTTKELFEFVDGKKKWDLDEIEARNDRIAEWACKRWNFYRPDE
jgi:uncharacterized protein with ParB-like and HNH nuclease domain